MNLKGKIEYAFRNRPQPTEVYHLSEQTYIDSDVEDAMYFVGRDWRTLTWDEWRQHYCAVTFFEPEAFAYYLPSVMTLALERIDDPLLAVDSLISKLDRTPGRENWDPLLLDRFLLLSTEEFEVLKEWLIELSNYAKYKGFGISASGPGDRLGRAFDTVAALQEEQQQIQIDGMQ